MNLRINLILIFILTQNFALLAQRQDKVRDVTIEIKSKKNNQLIEAAEVKIQDYEGTETDPNGIAFFPGMLEGNYTIKVYKQGYETYISPTNQFKVTSTDNFFTIELTPLPANSFLLRGRIVDLVNLNIDSVEVHLITGSRRETVYSDDWGYYEFKFNRNDIETHPEFTLTYRKKGFESPNLFNSVFYPNFIEIPPVKMNKSIKIEHIEHKIYRNTVLLIGISPNINTFFSEEQRQFQVTSSIFLKWNILKKQKTLTIGFGWRLPILLTTENSFQTLIGMKSTVNTSYRITNLGFVNFQFYNRFKNQNSLNYFIGASGFLILQIPETSIVLEGSHEADINSYYNILPVFSLGLSFKKGIFEFEPFISFTYFQLKSQNFKFNYFGRADSETILKKYIQFGIGVNLNVSILND